MTENAQGSVHKSKLNGLEPYIGKSEHSMLYTQNHTVWFEDPGTQNHRVCFGGMVWGYGFERVQYGFQYKCGRNHEKNANGPIIKPINIKTSIR